MAKPSLTMFDSNLRHSCKPVGDTSLAATHSRPDLDYEPSAGPCPPDTSSMGAGSPFMRNATCSDMRAILLRMYETSGNLYYLLEDRPATARHTPSRAVTGAVCALMRDCAQLLLYDGMLNRHNP